MSVMEFAETEIPSEEIEEKQPGEGMLICEECGNHFDHSGRGRKPKRCPNCRSTKTSGTASRSTRGNADVKSALAVLDGIYGAVAIGLLAVSPKAASVWAENLEQLQATNSVALAGDKKLCQSINRVGERTGKAMFAGAHIMALAPVLVTLRADLAERSKAKRPAKPPTDSPREATSVTSPIPPRQKGFFE